MQVWGVGPPPKATLIIFTMINIHPTMKVLALPWAAGRFEVGMEPLIDATLTGYARLNGCEEIEIRGREGWEMKLKSCGFKREAIVWTRPVPSVSLN